MKQLTLILIVMSYSIFGFSQSVEKCTEVIPHIIESIANKSSKAIEDHLCWQFTMAGQKDEIAKMVLRQTISQLDDKVTDYKKIGQTLQNEVLTLEYEFNYEKLGTKKAVFSFNEYNKLIELSLLEMEVMVMDTHSKMKKIDTDFIHIPFQLVGNLIRVKVILDGAEKDFLLDSGAPVVVLNSKYLKKKKTDDQQILSSAQGVNGAISDMEIVELESLHFGGIQINDSKVVAMNLAHLEDELGAQFHGLIGADMIRDYDILFDYEKSVITLIEPNSFEAYKKENLNKLITQIVPMEMQAHIPVIQIKIGTETMAFGIDCGAETNLIDDDLKSKLEANVKDIKADTLIGAENVASEIVSCKIDKLQIGENEFKNVETIFSDIAHLNQGYSLSLSGLIGYQILSKQKTLISFKRKELIFFTLNE